ncbi:ULK/ULK protein kinase Atg1 [Schizosaccharomyces japonicus yFS275]|uniref:non-specific serine/threonine protein kinase n=1 Tax=Schizosaccharomyces japonicus (strain yFS275 / FY16936) TaxID=402676 RepID=B6K6A4_SCHJY|nr:ULK/ULK protein kinase Atg1 [Schizosaccharomyces japonicus yFS275]EEB09058.1 ULK/ULK protein kinase Atg1 [Schizosaccharomyces japonicus yFS275]
MNELSQSGTRTVGPYTIGSEIGRGSFATVYKGRHSVTKEAVSIKSVLRKKLTKKLLENLESEISILKEIKHVHVVELYDCQKSGRFIHLIMEYCSLGDLSYFIRKREKLGSIPSLSWLVNEYPPVYKAGLNETLVRHFTQQLVSALQFLRSKSLIHRDVKPQNLLLQPPPTSEYLEAHPDFVGSPNLPILKLADFGFARYLQTASMAETLCGSPLYMAPEILRYEKYDAKADLWSLGTVLYEMAVGKPPFKAPNHVELLRRIQRAKDVIKFPEEAFIHPDIKLLICALLKQKPGERLGYEGLQSSMVITTPVDDACSLSKSAIQDAVQPITLPSSSPAFITDLFPRNTPPATGGLLRQAIQAERFTGAGASRNVPIPRRFTTRYSRTDNSVPFTPVMPPESAPVSTNQFVGYARAQNYEDRGVSSFKSNKNGSDFVVVDHDSSYWVNNNQRFSREYTTSSPTAGLMHPNSFSPESLPPNSGNIPIPVNRLRRLPSFNTAVNCSAPAAHLAQPAYDQFHTFEPSSVATPQSALARALNFANAKLHGNEEKSGMMSDTSSRRKSLGSFSSKPIILGEAALIKSLEELSTKCNAVFRFAEIKLAQVISPLAAESRIVELEANAQLPPGAIASLCKEAFVLYERDMELLQIGLDRIFAFKAGNLEQSSSMPVQQSHDWFRRRYNESFEKSQFMREKYISLTTLHEIDDSDNIEASHLIYNQALDMSRTAVTSELSGQDLAKCLRMYEASNMLLESLLEGDLPSVNSTDESNDAPTIKKFIALIRRRHDLVAQKMQNQRGRGDNFVEAMAKVSLASNPN